MTTKEFAKKWDISQNKVKQMLDFLPGITYCKHCKAAEIPDNAKAIYIPDKRKYSKKEPLKKYCYLIDTISQNMVLEEKFTGITKDNAETMVRHLYDEGYLLRKNNAPAGSYNYADYIVSTKIAGWDSMKSEEKAKIISDVLQTINHIANAVEQVARTAEAAINKIPSFV